ncbi:MAG: ribose 5-phosphate isomerase B [Thermaurantiacus tibetensis]
MRIAIASDHAGFPLKTLLAEDLRAGGHALEDLGAHDAETSVDYPDFGRACAEAVAGGRADLGVVVCGSGIGIAIAANRVPGVRCALVHDHLSARLAREHNDANMIALGARLVGTETARDALATFLATPFAGGRHAARVAKLG